MNLSKDMMHPKAREAMKKHLRKVLEACQIENGFPVFDSQIHNFSKAVSKSKEQWLSIANVYGIFIKILSAVLVEKCPEKEDASGLLKELVTAEIIGEIEGEIISFIESIPRNYLIYVPLPFVTDIGVDEVGITDDIKLEINKELIPGNSGNRLLETLTSSSDIEKVKIPLRIRVNSIGYASGSLDDSAFQYAISVLKHVTYLGMGRGIFKERKVAFTGFRGLAIQRHTLSIEILAVNRDNPEQVEGRVNLSNNFAELLEKFAINEELEGYTNAKKIGEFAVTAFFSAHFDDITKLYTKNDTYSSAIKSAIEWAFDANLSDNQTVSFVQTCIGLEAILGEDTGEEPLTATLADRCAYLLGKDPEKRKKIREKFKELYRLRSKVVHGRAVRLKHNEVNYLHWAKAVLDDLIKKEISCIESK